MEWSIHDWDNAPDALYHPITIDCIGLVVAIYAPGSYYYINIYDDTEVGAPGSVQIVLSTTTATKFVTIRYSHDPSTKTDTVQTWDINGNLLYTSNQVYTSTSGSYGSGVTLRGSGTGKILDTSYFRIYKSSTALNARQPATDDPATNSLIYWKFDGGNNTGTLADISGNSYTGTISTGSPIYVATPGQTTVHPEIRTSPSPIWGPAISWRAGHPGALDCSYSVSQADDSPNTSCAWQILSGPNNPLWSSHTAQQPILNNLTFGDYNVQLTATSQDGISSMTAYDIGAVATDDNYIVVQSTPTADLIFGPMIAFGHNPWGYEDERHYTGSQLRNYNTLFGGVNGLFPWTTPGQGTISYHIGGSGGVGVTATTTTVAITASSTTIPIANKTLLDLSEFPTHIMMIGGGVREDVRVCSETDGVGNAATLNVCYDGRGRSNVYSGSDSNGLQSTPHAFAAGSSVGQMKFSGTSTKFLTDPNRPICPAGAGMAPGSINSMPSVTLLNSSTNVVGIGTSWTSALAGKFLSVSASTGATTYPFVAVIASVQDSTHLTTDKTFTGTNGTYSGYITNANHIITVDYARTIGGNGRRVAATIGCESETSVYGDWVYDMGSYNATLQSGQHYSYKDSLGGAISAFGYNFYGEGLSHRSLYLRSGLSYPLTMANMIDENYPRDPEIDGAGSGSPLLYGGGMIGAIADLVTNSSTSLTFNDMHGFAAIGNVASSSKCNDYDTRDSGYLFSGLSLYYLLDPDPTNHATWEQGVRNIILRDTSTVQAVTGTAGCKAPDNSWANGFLYNTFGPAMDVTNGTTTVTAHSGSSFNSSTCYDLSHGTGTILSSSYVFVSSGLFTNPNSNNGVMVLDGTKNSAPFTQWIYFTYINSSTTYLASMWTGDSGAVNFIETNSGGSISVISSTTETSLMQSNWGCYLNSSSQVTLDRPWSGPTDTTGNMHIYTNNLAGYGEQPYMLGIRSRFMDWLKSSPDSDVASYGVQCSSAASVWEHNVAFDTYTLAMSYGRDYQACDPYQPVGYTGSQNSYRNGGACITGVDTLNVIPNARELNIEAASALKNYFEASSGNSTSMTYGDDAYGAIFGYCPWTQSGYYCDSQYAGPTTNLINNYLGAFKYFGFFFGMGMGHQWPAVRLGGVAAAKPRTISVGFNLASIANAAKFQITLTNPNGQQVTNTCTTSPCTVTADARQGNSLLTTSYLSSGNAVLASSSEQLGVTIQ